MNVRTILSAIAALLLIAAGLLERYRMEGRYDVRLQKQVERNLGKEFSIIESEASRILSPASTDAWIAATHQFLLVDSTKVLKWNQNHFLPDPTSWIGPDSLNFLSTFRGDFILRKWSAEKGAYLLSILTLSDKYPITNSFLFPKVNPEVFPVREISIVSPSGSAGSPVLYRGETLFRIHSDNSAYESTLSFWLITAGLVSLIVFIWRIKPSLEIRYGCDLTFVFIFAALLGIRAGMIALGLPALFLANALFDPERFASSSLNASMGDLLLNSICVLMLIVYVFLNFGRFVLIKWMLKQTGVLRVGMGVLCLVAAFYALLFPFNFVEVIYHNSGQSLDVTDSFSFDAVRICGMASVLIACISSFLFIHVLLTLTRHLLEKDLTEFFPGLLVASVTFYIQYYFSGSDYRITWTMGVVSFALLRLFNFDRVTFQFSFKVFIYLVFFLTIFSLQNGLSIRLFHQERQVKDQFRFGSDFLSERDVLGEYLLDQARQRIEADQFIQTRMASPFLSKSAVIDKVRRVHLNNYFDRYEIGIGTMIGDKPVSDSVVTTSNSFIPSGYKGISYESASGKGNTIKRYHMSIPVFYQAPVGSIEMDLSLKRIVPENVFPELLVDNRFSQIYRNRDFGYAVFREGRVTNNFGEYKYESDFPLARLENKELYNDGISDGRYFHVAIEDPDGSVAVVSAPVYSWRMFITSFSFWFTMGLAGLFMGQLFLGIRSFGHRESFNYSARIQLYIFLAFLLPLIVVSVTTLTLIGRSSEEAITRDFLDRSVTISQRLGVQTLPDAGGDRTRLEQWIKETAAAAKIDICVYSPSGKLIASSQPALFEDQLVSPLMNRRAWEEIVLRNGTQTVTNEHIGTLDYSCAWSALRSGSGTLKAIVGLPFFESAAFLQKNQSLVLSSILQVFVVVFILFSLLSFWAASSLTLPIRFIARTLGQTTLTGQNKPLQWNSHDEIGSLVSEYNKMLENLLQSKKALAQSEKESAWREMAKQVAHEIKNPLTPMKLTLQQLEQAIKSGELQPEKSQKSLELLLKQVDILNQIAVSFSAFASMPALLPQTVDLNTLIRDTVGLFAVESKGRIVFTPSNGPLNVSIDPTSLSRAISNLIINALQSRKDNQEWVSIQVSTSVASSTALMAIKDDGSGISDTVGDKIFEPQFTTKRSGSGLGLAMTRQIVLQAGGRIWFSSELNKGSTFFVEIPLLEA